MPAVAGHLSCPRGSSQAEAPVSPVGAEAWQHTARVIKRKGCPIRERSHLGFRAPAVAPFEVLTSSAGCWRRPVWMCRRAVPGSSDYAHGRRRHFLTPDAVRVGCRLVPGPTSARSRFGDGSLALWQSPGSESVGGPGPDLVTALNPSQPKVRPNRPRFACPVEESGL